MDGRQRFLSYFQGEEPDILPMFLRDFTLGLDNLCCRTTDLISDRYDPELSSRSVVSFARMTGQDAMVGCVHTPAFIVEQFGGGIKVSEYGVPMVIRNPLSSPEALDRADTSLRGKALDAIESYRMSRKACPDLAIVANVTGPLTKASVLMGMDCLSLALHDDIDFVKAVIRKGSEVSESFLDTVDDCTDAVFLASASDNPDLFGYDIIDSVTIPFVTEYARKAHDRGKPVIYHPHGDHTVDGIMEPIIGTGIDCFHFGENNDPKRICEKIDDRAVVMGGTDIVPTLFSGSPEDIRSETKRYIEACSCSRYIFSCSCSLQRGTPLQSIKEMCKAIR